jgi:prepilin peptidase CpaA
MEIWATLILVLAAIDDLRSQKVHNKLVIALLIFTFIALLVTGGPYSILPGLVSFSVALMFAIPLTLVRVIGGGDMKIFAVFGLATNISAVIGVAIFSILWGALLGLIRALFMGNFKELLLSTSQLLWVKGESRTEFKIPYTIALLVGWLTHLTLVRMGVSPW